MSYTKTYKQGSIWLADILYRDDPSQSKKRPVVVISDWEEGENDLLVIPITSAVPRNSWDVPVIHWKNAGLALPSCIRVSKLSTVYKQRLSHKLGDLTESDKQVVLKACQTLFYTEPIFQKTSVVPCGNDSSFLFPTGAGAKRFFIPSSKG